MDEFCRRAVPEPPSLPAHHVPLPRGQSSKQVDLQLLRLKRELQSNAEGTIQPGFRLYRCRQNYESSQLSGGKVPLLIRHQFQQSGK